MEEELETKPFVWRGLASGRAAAPTRSGTTNGDMIASDVY